MTMESITQLELADRLDLTTRQVRNLTKDGVLTRNSDGTYPWPRAQRQFQEWRSDVTAARDSLAEAQEHGTLPWDTVKKELGLECDE